MPFPRALLSVSYGVRCVISLKHRLRSAISELANCVIWLNWRIAIVSKGGSARGLLIANWEGNRSCAKPWHSLRCLLKGYRSFYHSFFDRIEHVKAKLTTDVL